MKHTPGPWHTRRGKYRMRISGDSWNSFAKVVVRMEGSSIDHPEGVANASLITAAPELLAELKKAEAALADIGDSEGDAASGKFNLKWAEKRASDALPTIRAVIAKATGAA